MKYGNSLFRFWGLVGLVYLLASSVNTFATTGTLSFWFTNSSGSTISGITPGTWRAEESSDGGSTWTTMEGYPYTQILSHAASHGNALPASAVAKDLTWKWRTKNPAGIVTCTNTHPGAGGVIYFDIAGGCFGGPPPVTNYYLNVVVRNRDRFAHKFSAQFGVSTFPIVNVGGSAFVDAESWSLACLITRDPGSLTGVVYVDDVKYDGVGNAVHRLVKIADVDDSEDWATDIGTAGFKFIDFEGDPFTDSFSTNGWSRGRGNTNVIDYSVNSGLTNLQTEGTAKTGVEVAHNDAVRSSLQENVSIGGLQNVVSNSLAANAVSLNTNLNQVNRNLTNIAITVTNNLTLSNVSDTITHSLLGDMSNKVNVANSTSVGISNLLAQLRGNSTNPLDTIALKLGDIHGVLTNGAFGQTNVSDQGTHDRLDVANTNLIAINQSAEFLRTNTDLRTLDGSTLLSMAGGHSAAIGAVYAEVEAINTASQLDIKAEEDGYAAKAAAAAGVDYQAGYNSGIMSFEIGRGASVTTLNINPFLDSDLNAVASWTRNLVVWMITALFIGWAMDYLFKTIAATPPGGGSAPDGVIALSWKVARTIFVTTALAALPSLIIAAIETRFGGHGSLSSDPMASAHSGIATGVAMLDKIIPLSVLITNVLSGLWFRMTCLYYLRVAEAITGL